jgi:hypothetical protein
MALSFLGIGTTRSGTTFLHERLRAHPGIWLPPQKELHYFNHQRLHGWWCRRHLKHVRQALPNLRRALGGRRGPAAELAWQLRYLFGPRSDAWYLSLYDAPGLVAGQIEPTYATLPLDTIRTVHTLLPEARLLYLMRDPIERAWSSVTKSTARNRNRPMARVPEQEIFAKIDRSALAMSRYREHIERWERVYPREQILYVFFEEIETQPALLLERVLRFLGVAPAQDRGGPFRPVNDTRRFKVEVPALVERHLAERLVEPTRALERRFGGYTTRWLERMEAALSGAGGGP